MSQSCQAEPRFTDGAKRVYAAVMCFYLAVMLLNSEGLHRNANRLPYGNWRNTAIRLTEPLVSMGRRLHVAGLRLWIEQHMDVYFGGDQI